MTRSKHWGDTYNWVEKVIDSVKTKEQVLSAYRLINSWGRQTQRNYPKLRYDFISNMEITLFERLAAIKI